MYYEGQGVGITAAMKLSNSCRPRTANAQFSLGYMYLNGRVLQNTSEALHGLQSTSAGYDPQNKLQLIMQEVRKKRAP